MSQTEYQKVIDYHDRTKHHLHKPAHGVRGTGIGCFFDDSVHDLLGLKDHQYQSLYHFTVGSTVEDSRLKTLPAYDHLNYQR